MGKVVTLLSRLMKFKKNQNIEQYGCEPKSKKTCGRSGRCKLSVAALIPTEGKFSLAAIRLDSECPGCRSVFQMPAKCYMGEGRCGEQVPRKTPWDGLFPQNIDQRASLMQTALNFGSTGSETEEHNLSLLQELILCAPQQLSVPACGP